MDCDIFRLEPSVKRIMIHFSNWYLLLPEMPHTHKREKKKAVFTGAQYWEHGRSDHRFCILEIKKLIIQVKKKLYQNTHKALEIQYSVCQVTSFASSAFVHSESRLYPDLCSSSCKIKAINGYLVLVIPVWWGIILAQAFSYLGKYSK